MTRVFNEKARNYQESQTSFDIIPSEFNLKSIIVKDCPVPIARRYISANYYLKGLPDSTTNAYIGYCGEVMAGICVFGTGAGMSIYSSVIPNISNGAGRELTRLWLPEYMPKNSESAFLTRAIKKLPATVKMVVSFSDEGQHHKGTIYQASNFYYLGVSENNGSRLKDKNGNEIHSRTIGIYRMRHPELKDKSAKEIKNIYELVEVENYPKHKYVLFRGSHKEKKTMHDSIKNRILPYPKKVEE